eukprot:UN14510
MLHEQAVQQLKIQRGLLSKYGTVPRLRLPSLTEASCQLLPSPSSGQFQIRL